MGKMTVWTLLTAVTLVVCGCGTGGGSAAADGQQKAAFRQVSADEAKKLMETESGYLIVDVRSQKEYDEGHIPRAICIPNETIGKTPPAVLPDKEQMILVYCRSGRRSQEASQKLADMGYTNIIDFGGIIDWRGEVTKE